MRPANGPAKSHREVLRDYILAGRHVISDAEAKPMSQIAAETGMSTTTVRHWLKADHYDEWLHYWPTVEALWAEWQKDKRPVQTMKFELPEIDLAAIVAADDVR